MSIKCQSWVYQYSEARGNDRLVLLAIADEADDDGANAYPGIARIAHKARMNERTTMRCIDRLEESGRLQVVRPEKRGRGHFNSYVVHMEEPPKGDSLSGGPLVEGPSPKGDTLSGTADEERVTETRVSPRKTAPAYLDRCRPIDPLTQREERETAAASPLSLRALPLPEDFGITDSVRTWAKQEAPTVDPDAQLGQFIDYHRARGIRSRDWDASMRSWLRKRETWDRENTTGRGNPAAAEDLAWFDEQDEASGE